MPLASYHKTFKVKRCAHMLHFTKRTLLFIFRPYHIPTHSKSYFIITV